MHRIQYPAEKKREAFEAKYVQVFQDLETAFAALPPDKKLGWSLMDFLTKDFEALAEKAIEIRDAFSGYEVIESVFPYEEYQGKISHFFMEYGEMMKLSACHYCGIEYINVYEDMGDYRDGLELVNEADEIELLSITGMGIKKARQIVGARPIESLDKLNVPGGPGKVVMKQLRGYKNRDKHYRNHFTLDHLLPKADYPHFALSLYNLIPSCYTCNSKTKGVKGLGEMEDLVLLSPSSDKFNVHEEVRVKMVHEGATPDKVFDVNDFSIRFEFGDRESTYKHYIQAFKLHGRYPFHKDKALDLIVKSRNYNEAMLKELEKHVKIPRNQIRMDIFGKDLFSEGGSHQPFFKLRLDVARALKIEGVI
jgi:hypothetical protein